MNRCEKCGETIGDGKRCYQVRYGYIAVDWENAGEFEPEEDVALMCEDCGIERGNFAS